MFTTSKGTTVEVTSITSFCDGTNGTSTSSSMYNGQTISGPTTVVVDGYTLKFNVPTANGSIALKITTPKGYSIELGVAQCKAPPP